MPRIRLSPATVIACTALAVALGGTGYAATVLPRNSVGTAQIRTDAVTSAKIRNGTLVRADFRRGQLTAGARGPRGPAGSAGPAGPTGPAGPAGTAASLPQGAVIDVQSAFGTTPSTFTGGFAVLPGSSVNVVVPAGETRNLYVTFTGESLCTGPASGRCPVRVTVDGNEAKPDPGLDFSFDSPGGGAESHGIVRTVSGLAAGTHTVQVQGASVGSGASLRLDDWALVAQSTRGAAPS